MKKKMSFAEAGAKALAKLHPLERGTSVAEVLRTLLDLVADEVAAPGRPGPSAARIFSRWEGPNPRGR